MLSIGIRLVISAIKDAYKNPKKAMEFKAVLLDLRNLINELYPGE
jgi:hypothetical protein